MNSIGILHCGREYYYVKLGKDDYYTNKEEPQGIFYGEGAERLGLLGKEIEHNDKRLKNLFQGINPIDKSWLRKGAYTSKEYEQYIYTCPETGKQKIFRHKEQIPEGLEKSIEKQVKISKSVIGYDNVFSAPKDVSVLWSQVDKEQREKINAIHKEAVKEAISYLESVCYTRRGTNGVEPVKVAGIFAVFHHTTSRALDPQLHSHTIMINSGFDKFGKAGALDGKRILNARYTSGMIYQNHLRGAIEKELGVVTYDRPFSFNRGTTFGIEGLSAEAKRHFSKRAVAIEKKITPKMSPLEIRAAVISTRDTKKKNVDHSKLFSQWKIAGLKQGINLKRILNKKQTTTLHDPLKFSRTIATAIALREGEAETISTKLTKDKAVFDPKNFRLVSQSQIINAALSASKGVLSTNDIFSFVDDFNKKYVESITVTKEKEITFRNAEGKLKTKQVSQQETWYQLSPEGRALVDYKNRSEKAHQVIKNVVEWHTDKREAVSERKQQNFKRKVKLLYFTGRIDRSQYRKITEGVGLPKSRFVIRTYQAVGLISKKQADYLIAKPELEKRFAEVAAWKQEQKNYKAWAKDKSEYEKQFELGRSAKAKREERFQKFNQEKAQQQSVAPVKKQRRQSL